MLAENKIVSDTQKQFWQLTNITYLKEKYRIDKNLQFLKSAPLTTLKKVFIQYRFFTLYYIDDLALLISKLPLSNIKTILADILFEELGNGKFSAAHPVLYDNFLKSIGITNAELYAANQQCLTILRNIQTSLKANSWSYAVGLRGMGGECLCQIYLSTMYGYFSENPAIKLIRHKIAWEFWDIHLGETDLQHQKIVREAIDEILLLAPHVSHDLLNGYLESATAWDAFWEQIFNIAFSKTNNKVSYATYRIS